MPWKLFIFYIGTPTTVIPAVSTKQKNLKEKKASWNHSYTVLVIQHRGRVVTDYKDRQKISDLQLISIRYLVKLVPKSKGQRGGGGSRS